MQNLLFFKFFKSFKSYLCRHIWQTVTLLYIILMFLFVAWLFITPFMYKNDPGSAIWSYDILAMTCHQLTQRSYCVFYEIQSYGAQSYDTKNLKFHSINNCLPEVYDKKIYTRTIIVKKENLIGYKFPVCTRCFAVYIAMLVGVIAYIIRKDKFKPPSIWLFILLILPLSLDGSLQFLGLHQSTNTLRTVTGFIAGLVVPIYLLPILTKMLNIFLEYKSK